jgi:flagellar L-ring protein precursor FlgH
MLRYTAIASLVASAILAPELSGRADSLFTQAAEKNGTLISEPTARFKEGDIITVLVREEIEASTDADTTTRKQSDVSSEADPNANPFLVGTDGKRIIRDDDLPNWEIETDNESRTRGETERRSSLTTTITCIVKQVYENGTLLVAGEKQVTVNREDSVLEVEGLVRSKDVTPANTILSSQMANAVVHLRGKGPLWNNQRRGFVTRFLDWFAPY